MTDRFPSHARVVVIGGGAVGCSIAYHLAKAGERDVLLLERKALTAGCTWHAAGLVGQLRGKATLTRLMQYGAGLYARIGSETGQDVGWHPVGSLRLAGSAARWHELKRAATAAKAYRLELELVGPAEIARLFPPIDVRGLEGAAWIPSDGYVDPYALTQAYAKGARAGGVRICEGVAAVGFARTDRRITAVETGEGTVGCEVVVNAAGLWARQVGELAGLALPVTVVEHQYLVTEKSPRVPAGLPTLRAPDQRFYLKPEPGALAIGGWEAETCLVNGLGQLPAEFGQQLLPEAMERIGPIAEAAALCVPLLNELGIRTVINGPIPISADGEPVIGPAGDFENFFVACGLTSGIAASGGVGRAMAEWILSGDPGMDLWPLDVRRFGTPHGGLAYLRDSAREAYAKYYAIAWPEEERRSCRPLCRSALYDALRARGAVHGAQFAWERPRYFLNPEETPPAVESFDRAPLATIVGREHRAVRERVGLADQSAAAKFEISGAGAFALLQHLAAGNLDRPLGSIVATPLLNTAGGIEASVTIMRPTEDAFYLISGAASRVRDGGWLNRHMPRDGSVMIRDVSSSFGVISLCGPMSREVLMRVSEDDVGRAAFPPMHCRWLRVGWAPALAARSGGFGELGWDLYVPVEYMAYVYETLLSAGAEFGIADVGTKATASLSMEKRGLTWGVDIGPYDTPLEAGLEFAVCFDKPAFVGREALLRQKQSGVQRTLACFRLDAALAVYGGEAMFADGRAIGITTSGNFGYTVGAPLVLGYLTDGDMNREAVEVEAFGRRTAAVRVWGAAYDPAGERLQI